MRKEARLGVEPDRARDRVRRRRAPVPAVHQRREGRGRTIVLVSRRVVLRGDRRDTRRCAPAPRTRSVCCTTGTGPARAGPRRRRACSCRSRSCTRTAPARSIGTDGTWQRASGRVASGRAAQRRGRVHRARRRPPAAARMGTSPGSTRSGWTHVAVIGSGGHRSRSRIWSRSARTSSSTRCEPVSVRTLPSGAVIADYGAVDRGAPVGDVRRTAWRAGRSRCTSGTCSIPTATCRPRSRPRAPT